MSYFIPSKTPQVLKQFFTTYTWDLPSKHEKKIYLTFDDGPTPEVTEFVLGQLHQFDAKATFFCIGKNIEKHPSIFKKIIKGNHAIGNHTMNHLKSWKSDSETYLKNIEDCENIISTYGYQTSSKKMFRPPYGQISYTRFKKLQEQNYEIVLWDVLSKDWEIQMSKEECLKNVLNHTEHGSIVVFHDSVKAFNKLSFALPRVLHHFSALGFDFDKIRL
ncbi:polysaccharide deacetylase family protein [Aquimarina sp. U1-2]|uniref:polysaccharide deacetylase family protein n=1 Tax=Aquimarina sp. U1-2 TaxID=2823141 RepID=UPI001AECFD14|nr:polysaccharide deacetylase family protein [Aquimarina sp. U1-2]MBP2832535.1 polysaccharide deacetylase family protein [Aquimarina sp. U1-2]